MDFTVLCARNRAFASKLSKIRLSLDSQILVHDREVKYTEASRVGGRGKGIKRK